MKLNNDKIIDVFMNISYLLWGGLLLIGTLIILVFEGVLNAEMIVLTIGLFVFLSWMLYQQPVQQQKENMK